MRSQRPTVRTLPAPAHTAPPGIHTARRRPAARRATRRTRQSAHHHKGPRPARTGRLGLPSARPLPARAEERPAPAGKPALAAVRARLPRPQHCSDHHTESAALHLDTCCSYVPLLQRAPSTGSNHCYRNRPHATLYAPDRLILSVHSLSVICTVLTGSSCSSHGKFDSHGEIPRKPCKSAFEDLTGDAADTPVAPVNPAHLTHACAAATTTRAASA